MLTRISSYRKSKGFSLLELAIALAVLGYLLFGFAEYVKQGDDYETRAENREILLDAKNALLAFVKVNGYLPCPDSDAVNDGIETRTGGICSGIRGRFPYQTLGFAEEDAWGNNLFYAIPTNANVAVSVNDPTLIASYFDASGTPPTFNMDTPPLNQGAVTGFLRVCGEDTAGCNAGVADENIVELTAVAVIVSFGENGAFTWNGLDIVNGIPPAGLSARETENADLDNNFLKNASSFSTVNVNQDFDDQLVWLTGFDVKLAMIKSNNGLTE